MSSTGVQSFLLALAVVLLVSRALGTAVAVWLHQPRVVGEILAGILLGPSVLGRALSSALFPDGTRMVLSGLADVGVVLFMFAIGMSIEAWPIVGRERVTGGAIAGATLVPFVLGAGLALVLSPSQVGERRVQFVVFVALAMSVTALPVLARMLADRNLTDTAIGGIALSAAAAVDLLAWAALAGLEAWVVGSQHLWRVGLLLPYGLVMVFVVRPLLRHLVGPGRRHGPGHPVPFVVLLVGMLLSAAAAEAIGIHSVFGAFLFGAMMPRHDVALRAEVDAWARHVTAILLPVYFVVAGLRVDLRGLDLALTGQLALIVLVGVIGKMGGTYLATRVQGLPPRPAGALAVLMNTRGLTELVILGIGLDLGLLTTSLYSLMVAMALLTTAMTGPLLSVIYRRPVAGVLRSVSRDEAMHAHGFAVKRINGRA